MLRHPGNRREAVKVDVGLDVPKLQAGIITCAVVPA